MFKTSVVVKDVKNRAQSALNSPWQPPFLFSISMSFFVLRFQMQLIPVWVISLSVTPSWFIHAVANGKLSFIFFG